MQHLKIENNSLSPCVVLFGKVCNTQNLGVFSKNFLAKNHQEATQVFENGIFYHKYSLFSKKLSPKMARKLFFIWEGVTTFMSTGYSFRSSLK
jgi:hypothetical protein